LDNPLIMDRWPDRFGQTGLDGVLRLTTAGEFTISGFHGDEVRIIPVVPAGAPFLAYETGRVAAVA